ncbi:hypothetical protein NPIL_234191 [Nephila pilipes]|uniref:Uncharacterized protein n=1 Tax=Nephila pilipes TaxID=299642 RepID=A0A8X6IMJ4_NEPPI|nr:hypothetical protein NPIL_234191 [Nephila pilipes]
MESAIHEIEEIKPMDLSVHSRVSNLSDILEESCLPKQNMRVFDSDQENASRVQKIDDIDHVYSSITRYMLLDTLTCCRIPSNIQSFLYDMQTDKLNEATEMMKLLDIYFFYSDFESIIEANLEILILSSEIDCAEYFLSRCLTLCAEPTYFSFMLVATFLSHTVLSFFIEYACFRIMYIIEFCFDVLYRRIFWQFFKSHDDYEKLLLYCVKFNDHMEPEPTASKLAATFYEINWINRVKDCINVTGDGFSLTESERELFETFYSIECAEDMSSELDKDLIGSLESEPGFKFHRVSSCGSKCYCYLDYVNQFPWA